MDIMVLIQVGLGFGLHFFTGFINAMRKGEKFDQGKLLSTALWGLATLYVLATNGQTLVLQLSDIDLGPLVATSSGAGLSAMLSKAQPLLGVAFDFLLKNFVRTGK